MSPATPSEIAEFDQRMAQSETDLAELVSIWSSTSQNEYEYYRLVGFIAALHDNVEPEALAEMLGIAILRLAAVGFPNSIQGAHR